MARKLPTFYTEDQMVALASAPDRDTLLGARDRAMLGVLCGSALRASELCSLTVADVLPDRVFVRCGKFGHQRWAPISPSYYPPMIPFLRCRAPGADFGVR